MGLELQPFRTRVARRIFLLFIVCAIVPITALAALSYYQVTRNQASLQYERLSRESKAIIVSLYERLLFLQSELELVAALPERRVPGTEGLVPNLKASGTGERRFEAIVLDSGTFPERPHVKDCRLEVEPNGAQGPRVLMKMAFVGSDAKLTGIINPAYLWRADVRLPAGARVFILGVDGTLLYGQTPDIVALLRTRLEGANWPHRGTLALEAGGHPYRAAYTNLFLEPNFKTGGWTVVVVEPKAEVSALGIDFVWTFPSLIIFSLGLVFMLGQYLIRRNMGPIETLQEATGRIAEGELGHAVDIESGDEFEDLGRAFNEMSRRLEEGQKLLVRTARMGAMGQLASGFVHEVRQPLSAIMGHVQLLMYKEQDPDARESLETVLGAIEDMNTIIGRFRTFSQETPMEKTAVNLNDVVREVERLIGIRFRKRGIECRLELADGHVRVWGDFRSLQQVVSNLMVNALDELCEKEDGPACLVIRTEGTAAQGILTVTDNGRGIPEEIRENVFDPFFTTKSAEKGTGLGMAIVETIVHQHNGTLELQSEAGAGTTIRIMIPGNPEEAQHED